MSLELMLRYSLPDSKAALKFARQLESELRRRPDTSLIFLTMTDPDLWSQWRQLGPNQASVTISDSTSLTHVRDQVLSLVDSHNEEGLIVHMSQLPKLCSFLNLGSETSSISAALGVMVSSKNQAGNTRFPGDELTKVSVGWSPDVLNLTHLKRVVESGYFGVTYLGFHGGGPVRLELVRRFTRRLVETGVFDSEVK